MKYLVLLTGVLFAAIGAAGAQATPTTGSWKVDGNVQGVPVIMTCAIVESEKVITGSCTGDDGAIHTIKGTVQEKIVTWAFDSAYQGQPITVTMSGTVDTTGLKMTGSIAVDPLQADGVFTATKQPPPIPTGSAKSPTTL